MVLFDFHSIIRIAMQYHPSLYYVMYLGTLLCAVQPNVFISLLWFLFIVYCLLSFFGDAAYSEYSYLVEIVVDLIFECNIQKSVPGSLHLKKHYVIFKNRNM